MDRLRYYLDGRLFEWVKTVSMLTLSWMILEWPDTLRASAFQWLVLVMHTKFIGGFLLSVGLIRVVGLLLNGHTWRGVRLGPVIRSVTAVFSAIMWAQFAVALLQLSFKQGFPSPGIPFWTSFVFGELYVAYRAVAGDGRYP